MVDSNEFIDSYALAVGELGLEYDLIQLCQYEKAQGDVQAAGALFGLIPDFGYVEKLEKVTTIAIQKDIDTLRERVSTNLLNAINAIKPDQFENKEQARAFDDFLHRIDGSMLTPDSREAFTNLRQRVRMEWVADGAKQEAILAQLAEEREQQRAHRAQLMQFASDQLAYQRDLSKQLMEAEQGQRKRDGEMSGQLKAIDEVLVRHGMQLDEYALALLQGDAVLTEQLGLVVNYLEKQEKEAVEAALKAQEQYRYEGLAKGFAFLGALGEVSGKPALQKISVLGTQGVQVHLAVKQFMGPGVAGMAVLNPMAAIGMAVLSMASAFMKKGPNANELIMKQLQQISQQLATLQDTMEERFKDVRHHLDRMERSMVFHFQQLQYLLIGPVSRQFDRIRYDLNELTALLKVGMEELLLADLNKQFALVESLDKAIIDFASLGQAKVIETLVALSQWVREQSSSKSFTGEALFRGLGARLMARQSLMYFKTASERKAGFDAVLPPMLIIAQQEGWLPHLGVRMPHMGIWEKSLEAYVKLRAISQHASVPYDAKKNELSAIFNQAKTYAAAVNCLVATPDFIEGLRSKVMSLLHALTQQCQAVAAPHADKLKMFALDGVESSTELPTAFSFEYVRGGAAKKKGNRQKPFTKANGMTQLDCLRIVSDKSKQAGAPIFDAVLLQAEKLGLVEFQCRMHRTMSNGGKQVFETDGKRYGLEISLYIKESQERIPLTEATGGHAKWDNAHHNTTHATIESHRRALGLKTKVLPDNIKAAVATVTKLLSDKSEKAKLPFYQVMAEVCLQDDSLLHEVSAYLYLMKCYLMVSPYALDVASVEPFLSLVSEIQEASFNPSSLPSQQKIDDLIRQVPKLIDDVAKAPLLLSLSERVEVDLGVFERGVKALLEFDESLVDCPLPSEPVEGGGLPMRYMLTAQLGSHGHRPPSDPSAAGPPC